MKKSGGSVTQDVTTQGHVEEARRKAENLCSEIGFSSREREDISLVVMELSKNILKHAVKGRIVLQKTERDDDVGIEVEAFDNGPGIPNIENAIKNGVTTGNSLGYGLGTINRLVDSLKIESPLREGRGTHISAVSWLKKTEVSKLDCPLDVGAATRAHPNMHLNGDAFFIKKWDEHLLVSVIDGLGHGQFAHRASRTAVNYLEKHYDQPFIDIFRGVGRACRSTRGIVMALARFDWVNKIVTTGNVGNIEIRVFRSREPLKIVFRRGILGSGSPKPAISQNPWDEKGVMVMYSDGIKTHWNWNDFSQFHNASATVLARKLLSSLARDNDDATVLVVKEKVGG